MTPTDHDLPPLDATPPGLYRHYKGGWYEVIDTVRCSETLQGLTLYRALYGSFGLWVRPATMFAERGVFDGRMQPRFTPHDPADVPLADRSTAQALIVHLRGRAWRERGLDLDAALRPPPLASGRDADAWADCAAALHRWRSDALALLACRDTAP